MAAPGGAGATDSAAATPVGRSYGRDCSRSGSRRRFGSKCNPRVNDCRPEGFAIPASRRRLAFTRRPCARDDERNGHLNPTGIPLEQAGKRLLRLFDCCLERKLRRYPRTGSTNVVFRSSCGSIASFFFCCLTLAVFSQTLPISS